MNKVTLILFLLFFNQIFILGQQTTIVPSRKQVTALQRYKTKNSLFHRKAASFFQYNQRLICIRIPQLLNRFDDKFKKWLNRDSTFFKKSKLYQPLDESIYPDSLKNLMAFHLKKSQEIASISNASLQIPVFSQSKQIKPFYLQIWFLISIFLTLPLTIILKITDDRKSHKQKKVLTRYNLRYLVHQLLYPSKPRTEDKVAIPITQNTALYITDTLRTESPTLFEKPPNVEVVFLQKLNQLVQDEIANPNLNAAMISKRLQMSQAQTYRQLKALTGKTPTLFIRSIRLKKAKELLETGQFNVSQVAYDVGYTDPNYFSRVFSKEYGKSPVFFYKKLTIRYLGVNLQNEC